MSKIFNVDPNLENPAFLSVLKFFLILRQIDDQTQIDLHLELYGTIQDSIAVIFHWGDDRSNLETWNIMLPHKFPHTRFDGKQGSIIDAKTQS